MTNNAIHINSLSKKYKDFYAVNKASLTIERGKIYGLIGKNGAGKTTLFKLILGLSEPSEGSISVSGSQNMDQLRKERSHIGFYINPNFYDYMGAYQNLEYYRILKNIKDKNEVSRVLKIVGLDGVKKPYKTFSMGMKQRLGIANALMGNPDIIILDEPINGLDPQGIVEIRHLLKDLNKKYNKTLIISSHILSELDLLADTFAIIDHGVILEEVSKENFKNQDISSLKLNTSDNTKTASLFEEHFGISSTPSNDKYIYLDVESLNHEMLKTLIVNEIQIIEIIQNSKSLEDHYFELTERGTQNV